MRRNAAAETRTCGCRSRRTASRRPAGCGSRTAGTACACCARTSARAAPWPASRWPPSTWRCRRTRADWGEATSSGSACRSAAGSALAGVEHLAARGLVDEAGDPAGRRIQSHAHVLVFQRQLRLVDAADPFWPTPRLAARSRCNKCRSPPTALLSPETPHWRR